LTVAGAGITPLAAGGKDKWPLHFYPAFLLMRILGKEGMEDVIEGKNGGFNSPDAVKAFEWSAKTGTPPRPHPPRRT